MLVHDFYQVDPQSIAFLNEMQISNYITEQKNNLVHMSLSDNMVRRNLGRIDKVKFDALDLNTYCPKKMKFFSSFINNRTDNHTVGLNYYGITLMDRTILEKLAARQKHICFVDVFRLRAFICFCKEANENGKWVVHYGI